LNYGKGVTGDGYVYLYGSTAAAFFGNGPSSSAAHTYLARVPSGDLLSFSSYEIYAGTDQAGNPVWNSLATQATTMQPVFTDRGPTPLTLGGVIYDTGLHRYIGVAEGNVNQAAFYDAPTPWGPWTSIGYYGASSSGAGGWGNLGTTSFNGGSVGAGLGINFINAWTSSNGLTLYAAFSSDGTASASASLASLAGKSLDSLNIVSVTLTPAP
jgi:hypothetical protein